MRFVVTAGFDRATHAVGLVDGLLRDGHAIAALLVVTPYDLTRARALMRRGGAGALKIAVRRLAGGSPAAGEDEMEAWLDARGVRERSLGVLAKRHAIPRVVVGSLNDPRAVATLETARPDRVIYAGGGILRRRFLAHAGEGVLNAHSGPLPEIRGMNACEWSLLLGLRPAVTIHLIDEGIDTGRAIEEIPLPVRRGDTIPRLRSRCAVVGVEGLLRAAARPLPHASDHAAPAPGRQCYLLARALRELLVAKLASGRIPS